MPNALINISERNDTSMIFNKNKKSILLKTKVNVNKRGEIVENEPLSRR